MPPSTSTNERSVLWRVPLGGAVRAAAFWAAVLLPFVAFALVLRGLSTPIEYGFFVSVIAGNLVALVVGHGYATE